MCQLAPEVKLEAKVFCDDGLLRDSFRLDHCVIVQRHSQRWRYLSRLVVILPRLTPVLGLRGRKASFLKHEMSEDA